MRDLYKYVNQFIVIYLLCMGVGIAVNINFGFNYTLDSLLKQGLTTFLYTSFIYIMHLLVFLKLTKFLKEVKKSTYFMYGLLGSFVVTTFSFLFIRFSIAMIISEGNLSQAMDDMYQRNNVINLLFCCLVSALVFVVLLLKATQDQRLNHQEVVAIQAKSQFESLKNQIDPHFLFNSLNVLSALIEENPDKAQDFTVALSKVYRYVLEQRDKELVDVADELKFANTFLKLMEMRFEDGLFYEIPDTLSASNFKIVPLSLQILLENAVKHNEVSKNNPLHIKIYELENKLIITNNIQTKNSIKDSAGVGLQNIRNQYELLTDKPIEVINDQLEFKVALPLLTQQLTASYVAQFEIKQQEYERAWVRVKEIKDFYWKIFIFSLFLIICIILNVFMAHFPTRFAIFGLIFWGISLIIKGMKIFVFSASWEERKLKYFMEKEGNKQHQKWK